MTKVDLNKQYIVVAEGKVQ